MKHIKDIPDFDRPREKLAAISNTIFINNVEYRKQSNYSLLSDRLILNRQAQYHSSGCSSGGQPMHSVVILESTALAKYVYSISPPDLQG